MRVIRVSENRIIDKNLRYYWDAWESHFALIQNGRTLFYFLRTQCGETVVAVPRDRSMVDLKSVKSATRTLASELRRSFASDQRTASLLAVPRQNRGINDDDTGGYWVRLGRLDGSISVELWLDHYSGLSTPLVWIGFRSASLKKLSRLVRLATLTGFRKPPFIKNSNDITSARPWHFRSPLHPGEMDVLVLEKYPALRSYFLGMYLSYSWPIQPRVRRTIVHDAINLIGGFTKAWVQSDGGVKPSSLGPWARPNPVTEAKAVRFVRRALRALGYTVKSRENEICGYDLHAVKEGSELHVEVKGTTGSFPRFFISRNEYNTSLMDPNWRLAVVLVGGVKPISYDLVNTATMRRTYKFVPIEWEARPNNILDHKHSSS